MENKSYKLVVIVELMVLLLFVLSWNAKAEEALPTRLLITVMDQEKVAIEGVVVKIYLTEKDYLASENAVMEATTNSRGQVKFTDLEPSSYFIEARKGDLSNDAEKAITTPLEEGKRNKVKLKIY